MCKSPLKLKDRIVACGHCIPCLIQRSQQWAFRLEEEAKNAKSGMFLTLTYSDENAIWIDSGSKTLTTLDKTDVQKFMRALRQKEYKGREKVDWQLKVRYFACGEYGGKTKRAHYHAIIFNVSNDVKNQIPDIWGKGHVKIGDVSPKSIRYVTNYMLLKDVDLEEGQSKPFTLMSKKPIIGANYVVKNYPHHIDTKSYKLKYANKHEKFLYKTYEERIFTKEELIEIRRAKQLEIDKMVQDEDKKWEQKDPLDPLGAKVKSNQEELKQIRRKAFKKLKERTL